MNLRIGSGAVDAAIESRAFQIILNLSVDDTEALWSEAVRRSLQVAGGLKLEDIVECVGPREDPSIEDCLAILALSKGFEGCTLTDIAVTSPSVEKDEEPEAGFTAAPWPSVPLLTDRSKIYGPIAPGGDFPLLGPGDGFCGGVSDIFPTPAIS